MEIFTSVWAEFWKTVASAVEWYFNTGLPKETAQTIFNFLNGDFAALVQHYIDILFS